MSCLFNLPQCLFYAVPWWAWAIILGVPAAVALYFLVRTFGWERVKGWIPAVIAAIAAATLLTRAKQQGYQDRRAEEEKALDQAQDFANDKRDDVHGRKDDKLDAEVKRWERP